MIYQEIVECPLCRHDCIVRNGVVLSHSSPNSHPCEAAGRTLAKAYHAAAELTPARFDGERCALILLLISAELDERLRARLARRLVSTRYVLEAYFEATPRQAANDGRPTVEAA